MNLSSRGSHQSIVKIYAFISFDGFESRATISKVPLKQATLTIKVAIFLFLLTNIFPFYFLLFPFYKFLHIYHVLLIFVYFAVRFLKENELYSFQVFALSTNDYQVGSNEFDLRVPFYRIKMRLIAISVTVIILTMLVFAAIFIFVKKRCLDSDNDAKLQRS